MKVFITASFEEGKNKDEIEGLCLIVKNSGFKDFCFIRDVENYKRVFDDSKELMERTREEINKCDVLLFDASEKSTGRAIEVGIAYSLRKKIIVIMNKGTVIKDTIQGVADAIIEYKEIGDIQVMLEKLFIKWNSH